MLGVVNTNVLKYFLYESYAIEKRTEFLTKIQSLDDDEITEALIDDVLENLLLFRVINDPGLCYHVLSGVKNNKEFLERIRSIILQLYGKTVEFDCTIDSPDGVQVESSMFGDVHCAAEQQRSLKVDYLRYRLEYAEKVSESDEKILAIKALLDEEANNIYSVFIPNLDNPGKHVLQNNDPKIAKCMEYICQNIRFFYLYRRPSEYDRIYGFYYYGIFLILFPFCKEICSDIFRTDLHHDLKDNWSKLSNFESLRKFTEDLIAIICNEWFMSLNRAQKLDCINKTYPFNKEHVKAVLTEIREAGCIDLMPGDSPDMPHNLPDYMCEPSEYDLVLEYYSFFENHPLKPLAMKNASKLRSKEECRNLFTCATKRFQFERAIELAEKHSELDPNFEDDDIFADLTYDWLSVVYELNENPEYIMKYCNNRLKLSRHEDETAIIELFLSMCITECECKITDEVRSLLKDFAEYLHNGNEKYLANIIHDDKDAITNSLILISANMVISTIHLWKNDDLKISYLDEVAKIFTDDGLADLSVFRNKPVLLYFARRASYKPFYSLNLAEKLFERSLYLYPEYNQESTYYDLISVKGYLNKKSEAEKIGKEALSKYPDSFLIRTGMSEFYLYDGEFSKAKEYIDEAEELMSKTDDGQVNDIICHSFNSVEELKKKIDTIKQNIDSFKGEYISFKKIKSAEAYRIMKTGDHQYFNAYKNQQDDDELDYSPIIIQYGKAVEKLLDDTVTRHLRDCLQPDEIKGLRKGLQHIFGDAKKSVSLGIWHEFYANLPKIKNKNLSDKLCNEYYSLLSKEDRENLGKYCSGLAELRNGAAHITFNSKEDVDEQRKKVVNLINSIIDITAKIPSQ